jgi:hypothetical protein
MPTLKYFHKFVLLASNGLLPTSVFHEVVNNLQCTTSDTLKLSVFSSALVIGK